MDDVSIFLDTTRQGVDQRLDASLNRLNVIRGRLSEMLWDTDSTELRDCLVDLDAVIRDQVRVQQDLRTVPPALRTCSDA